MALSRRLIFRLTIYTELFLLWIASWARNARGEREADNIKTPCRALSNTFPYWWASANESKVGFWNFHAPVLEIRQLTHCPLRKWLVLLSERLQYLHCTGTGNISTSCLRCIGAQIRLKRTHLDWHLMSLFKRIFVNIVTVNSVFALSYSQHKSVLFIWRKTKQKHSLEKAENTAPKALYMLIHNTFTFFLANSMQHF